ncbi:hypothetical protein DESC_660120 [Desulfosarcina cetonica]|nr:hypothetical protein DESC_660120 [Desulfosarcina cetonica]
MVAKTVASPRRSNPSSRPANQPSWGVSIACRAAVTLHRQVVLDHLFVQMVDGLAGHHPPTVEDGETVGHGAGEGELLLHQQNGHAHLGAQSPDDRADLLDDVGLNAFRGLVEDQERRLQDQGPADGQLLLLAAGKIAAQPAAHLIQHRKEIENPIRNAFQFLLAGGQANGEILFHGQQRKDLTALGHIPHAQARAPVGGQSGDVGIHQADPAGANRQKPHDATQEGGLAHAVPAHQAGALALGHLQINIPEGMALTVKLVEFLYAEHWVSPR